MSVPKGRPHGHTLPNALALCTHIHADTCRHAVYLLPQLWSLLSFAQTNKSACFCPISRHRTFYNVTHISLDERKESQWHRFQKCFILLYRLVGLEKSLYLSGNCPRPAERHANAAPVSPPSRFGARLFFCFFWLRSRCWLDQFGRRDRCELVVKICSCHVLIFMFCFAFFILSHFQCNVKSKKK